MDNSKFIWPVTVVLSSTILAGSFYFVQQNKAISIEKQQQEQLQLEREKTKVENEKISIEKEMKQKEYVSKRKKDCLEIYASEGKKWNNVNSWWYTEPDDVCVIQYINQKWKSGTPEIGEWNETLKQFENGKYFTSNF